MSDLPLDLIIWSVKGAWLKLFCLFDVFIVHLQFTLLSSNRSTDYPEFLEINFLDIKAVTASLSLYQVITAKNRKKTAKNILLSFTKATQFSTSPYVPVYTMFGQFK